MLRESVGGRAEMETFLLKILDFLITVGSLWMAGIIFVSLKWHDYWEPMDGRNNFFVGLWMATIIAVFLCDKHLYLMIMLISDFKGLSSRSRRELR